MKTKTVFRKFKAGNKEVIAIFYDELDEHANCFMSYMHIGQHGPCSYFISDITTLATPEEYADLKAELEDIGYTIEVYKRIQRPK